MVKRGGWSRGGSIFRVVILDALVRAHVVVFVRGCCVVGRLLVCGGNGQGSKKRVRSVVMVGALREGADLETTGKSVGFLFHAEGKFKDVGDPGLGFGIGFSGDRLLKDITVLDYEVLDATLEVVVEYVGDIRVVWVVGGHAQQCGDEGIVVFLDGAEDELATDRVGKDLATVL